MTIQREDVLIKRWLWTFSFFFFFPGEGSNRTYSCWPTPQPQPTQDPSCICDLHNSWWPCCILNPLSEARDGTCVLMVTSQVCFWWATMGTPHSGHLQGKQPFSIASLSCLGLLVLWVSILIFFCCCCSFWITLGFALSSSSLQMPWRDCLLHMGKLCFLEIKFVHSRLPSPKVIFSKLPCSV